MLSRTRNRVGAICAVALGSGAIALGAAGAFDTTAAVAGHRHHHHHHHHGCIPQHNGGDHDSDNNGGPSDGDGCT
jgi:TPP-dependent pyruvate/acetoin dehydrogenase alpha subunit